MNKGWCLPAVQLLCNAEGRPVLSGGGVQHEALRKQGCC